MQVLFMAFENCGRLFQPVTTIMLFSVRICWILILVMLSRIMLSAAQTTIAELIQQRSELSMVSKRASHFTCLPVVLVVAIGLLVCRLFVNDICNLNLIVVSKGN